MPNLRNKTDVDSLPVKSSLFLMGIGASGMLLIKPIIVGGLMANFGYTAAQAGLVAGSEMAGVGLGTLIVVLFGATWSGRTIALIGGAIDLIATIGPSLWSSFPIVLVFRLSAGIGCGLLISVVIAAIAVTRDPDRSFSLYYMFVYVTAALCFPLATALAAAYGVQSAYLFLACLLAPVFLLFRQIPMRGSQKSSASRAGGVFPFKQAAISLSASVIYWMGAGAVWAFIERIGVSAGLSETEVGGILGSSQATFILGALTASLLYTRIGRTIPAVGAVVMSIAALALLRSAAGPVEFALSVFLFTFAWTFFFAYMTGTMAAQDPAGRIAVLGVPSQTAGLALGPSIVGYLVNGSDYGAVILFGAIVYGIAILVFLPALLTADRARGGVAVSEA